MRIIIEDDYDNSIILETKRPANGLGAYLVGSEGWFGTPAPREEPIERYQVDGDMKPNRYTQGSRSVTFNCAARFSSSIETAEFVDKINALSCDVLSVIHEGPNGRRSCRCFLADDPSPEFHENDCVVLFDMILTCPDPLKYGDAERFPVVDGQCEVVNRGTAPSWPVIEVIGPVSYLTVSKFAQTVSWKGQSNHLYIDFSDMQVYDGKILSDNAFSIFPGKRTLEIETDGQAVVSLRPAWR